MYIYPQISIVLYGVVTYATARICNLTYQEMSSLKDQIENISDLEVFNCLQKWKIRQELVNQTVDAINDCFGFTLLLVTYIIR